MATGQSWAGRQVLQPNWGSKATTEWRPLDPHDLNLCEVKPELEILCPKLLPLLLYKVWKKITIFRIYKSRLAMFVDIDISCISVYFKRKKLSTQVNHMYHKIMYENLNIKMKTFTR